MTDKSFTCISYSLGIKWSSCDFLCRSDYSQHAVCLPDEEQEGVAVLGPPAPPAGPTLLPAARHAAHRQHAVRGPHRSGDHRVPPRTSLCAVPPRKGCLFRAAAAGGTLILRCIYIEALSQCFSYELFRLFYYFRLCSFI